MQFNALTLYTNELVSQRRFYEHNLNLNVLKQSETHFTVAVGRTILTFRAHVQTEKYHYCFLLPANQLSAALEWFKERDVELLTLEGGGRIQHFEDWNAHSFYFFDGAGHLAECIVRYDLENSETGDFSSDMFINVNEVGLPAADIVEIHNQLSSKMGTVLWKGDLSRFAAHGNQQGLFILVNYQKKKTWFPTELPTCPLPFEATIVVDDKLFECSFRKEKVTCTIKPPPGSLN